MASAVAVLSLSLLWGEPAYAAAPIPYQYLAPRPQAQLVSAGTTIAVRPGPLLDPDSLGAPLFEVRGQQTGLHSGDVYLAADGRTVIFYPQRPFQPGETVSVQLAVGLRSRDGLQFPAFAYTFQVGGEALFPVHPEPSPGGPALAASTPTSAFYADPVTLPTDLPQLTITVPAQNTAEGYLFLSPFNGSVFSTTIPYLLILEDSGEPVFMRRMTPGRPILDFNLQPNGWLTYFDFATGAYYALDQSYQLVDEFRPGNGYPVIDHHELRLLPNGNALFMIYDRRTVDMSQIVAGGVPTATVIGLVVQELDLAKHVVFEWRSWDHIPITDTLENVTRGYIDYAHGNAIEVDSDEHLMVSMRNLNQVIKIHRQTGQVIWRWGGKSNQFTFTDNDPGFSRQHDIRRLANGNVTLFDNGNDRVPRYSRAVEYRLDEAQMTATPVWSYRRSPDVFGHAMGNAQRLANGNTLIGWGSGFLISEVEPDGTTALEIALEQPQMTYRAFRYRWHAIPAAPPALRAQSSGHFVSLLASWNGATGVSAYQVYGGHTPATPVLLSVWNRTGFETTIDITLATKQYCFFRVIPVGPEIPTGRASSPVQVWSPACNPIHLPLMAAH